MEKFPSSQESPEKIHTKGEIIEVISRFAENTEVIRELSDDQGLYLLEVKLEGKEPGETIQYEYMRKGRFPDHNESSGTVIHVVYYENGMAVGGHDVANYNHETGEWDEVK